MYGDFMPMGGKYGNWFTPEVLSPELGSRRATTFRFATSDNAAIFQKCIHLRHCRVLSRMMSLAPSSAGLKLGFNQEIAVSILVSDFVLKVK